MYSSANWDYSRAAYFLECLSELFSDSHLWEADELSLQLYFKDVRRIKPVKYRGSEYYDFTKENEVIAKAQNGGQSARQTIIHNHLRYVIQIAKKYQNKGLLLNDIISEGNIGLIEAIDKFDTTRGFSFRTHARYYIVNKIRLALNKYGGLIHYPLNYMANYLKVQKCVEKFLIQNDYLPASEEVSQELKFEVNVVDDCIDPLLFDISLDEVSEYLDNLDVYDNFVNSSSDLALLLTDSLNIDEDLKAESMSIDISDALDLLLDNEKTILKMAFGFEGKEYSINEIAEVFHLSGERIRQLRDRAIRKLKYSAAKDLRCYLN